MVFSENFMGQADEFYGIACCVALLYIRNNAQQNTAVLSVLKLIKVINVVCVRFSNNKGIKKGQHVLAWCSPKSYKIIYYPTCRKCLVVIPCWLILQNHFH